MQALQASVQEMVGSVNKSFMKGGENAGSETPSEDLLQNATKLSMEPAVNH